MQALAALTKDADGQIVVEYLEQNAAALMKRSCSQVADSQCRKDQGAGLALAELVNMTESASKIMRGHPHVNIATAPLMDHR